MSDRILWLLAATAALGAGTATAADLENRDDVGYDVRLHSGASTTHSSIGGHTTQLSVCSDCTVEVVGIGEVAVDASVDAVIIENGAIRTE
ncbi:MAG: hypothetical protein R3F55_02830 [Alphaproteobacteria bacterium]